MERKRRVQTQHVKDQVQYFIATIIYKVQCSETVQLT